jgi:hypothetical protein
MAVGRADTRPRGDNSTLEGRAENRRVEIVIRVPGIAESGVDLIGSDPVGLTDQFGEVAGDGADEPGTDEPDTGDGVDEPGTGDGALDDPDQVPVGQPGTDDPVGVGDAVDPGLPATDPAVPADAQPTE